MSFSVKKIKSTCSHKCNHRQNTKTLQASSNEFTNAYIEFPKIIRFPKRMSPVFLKKLRASMTVEASIAIPLFIFFMINLMSLVNVFNLYGTELSKLQQSARTASYMQCNTEDIGADTVTFFKFVPIKPYIGTVNYATSTTLASMTYRKWTGYNVLSGSTERTEEEYVYITEHGYSYHRSRNCRHLKVTIQAVTLDDIELMRNRSGGRYRPCERCGGNSTGILFITPEGDRYHSDAACSGLKRTIKTVKLSEVGSRTPCSQCGY